MKKTTLDRSIKIAILLVALWGQAQTQRQAQSMPTDQTFAQQQHQAPSVLAMQTREPDHELLSARSRFSKTVVNKDRTKTVTQSSAPLHYQDAKGDWQPIDYRLTQVGGKTVYPAQQPFFEWDGAKSAVLVGSNRIDLPEFTRFAFVSKAKRKFLGPKPVAAQIAGNRLELPEIVGGVDKSIAFYPGAFHYDYTIKQPSFVPVDAQQVVLEEMLRLPAGYTLRSTAQRLAVLDAKGQEVMVFHQPVVSDSAPIRDGKRPTPYEVKYSVDDEHASGGYYAIRIFLDAAWLRATERVYPVTVDPVVTLSNLDAINSCFLPSYEQATLSVAVPAGESVLSTNISYDFVALAATASWISDQRSFVSGPNGQTPTANVNENFAGTHTYTVSDSPIGNSVSSGQVDYVFNFARNWGGSGCNATYCFANRREVQVTYGTIEFGNGPLVINEYSASNRNFNDGFDRNEDWIELYNSNPDMYFDLSGYYLSNNAQNPTKFQMPSGILPPGGRVLVFCSNRGITTGATFHTNFDLTQTDGDDVVLADPSGTIVESHPLFITQTNHSYGRTADGAATWGVFATPTPNAPNAAASTGYAPKPIMSLGPGRYATAINVSLSASGADQIRYTTDGSTPTSASQLYTGPIAISQSTVLRARGFSTSASVLPGFIETNSYFINESSTLPVVSIAGDPDLLQLLGGTTIEPTGNFEFFETDGSFIDETVGDFDRHGNDSWAYDQRGIDFIARDDHGYKRRLEHQFFGTTQRGTFRRLILKAAGSDNFPGQEGGAHLRDVFAQTLSQTADLELDERRARFVQLFVNGQYWGVYDLREKVDDNQYTDYYYGQDYIYRDSDDYIQFIKTWGSTYAEFGNQPALDAWASLLNFVQANDMSVEANYNYVESQLNIDSLVDYFVLNSYLVNKDWLNWNTSWWRGLDPSGGALKWRYALWDVDGILGHYINYTGIPDISADAPPCQVEQIPVGEGHAQTIAKLVQESPIVRQKYITRYADLLNTKLSCAQVTAVFDSIVAIIAPEMPRHCTRWGGSFAQWQANVQTARDFLLTRCSQTISTGLNDCYETTGPFETVFQVEPAEAGKIRMNSEWIANYPFTAQVLGNIDTLLKAEGNMGYVFDHWEVDGATISPDANSVDIVLQIAAATTVTAYFTEVVNPEDVIYYWHFNTLDTSNDVTTIAPDFSDAPTASPLMTYTGSGPRDIDGYNTGSAVNLHLDQTAGRAARVRNPAEGRTVVFDLPTVGYRDLKFAYAVQRTNEGMLDNIVSYSLDGLNFQQDGLAQAVFPIGTNYGLVQLDFTSIVAANQNANFKVQIAFQGNTTGDNGNNRMDNVTLKGVAETLSTTAFDSAHYQVFPNPTQDRVQIVTNVPMTQIEIFDLVGKKVLHKETGRTQQERLDLGGLQAGVYLLKVKTEGGVVSEKVIKR